MSPWHHHLHRVCTIWQLWKWSRRRTVSGNHRGNTQRSDGRECWHRNWDKVTGKMHVAKSFAGEWISLFLYFNFEAFELSQKLLCQMKCQFGSWRLGIIIISKLFFSYAWQKWLTEWVDITAPRSGKFSFFSFVACVCDNQYFAVLWTSKNGFWFTLNHCNQNVSFINFSALLTACGVHAITTRW